MLIKVMFYKKNIDSRYNFNENIIFLILLNKTYVETHIF